MSRSLKKAPFVEPKLYARICERNEKSAVGIRIRCFPFGDGLRRYTEHGGELFLSEIFFKAQTLDILR